MTIIEKIKSSMQAVLGNDFPVYYHDEITLNDIADHMTYPCVYVQLLTQGQLMFASGQTREQVTAAVFFVEPSTFDFDAVENEVIIDRCKRRAMKWLDNMPMDEWLTLGGVEVTSRIYEQFDAILTGYGMRLRLTELQGWTNCVGDFNNDFNNDFNI